MKGLAGRLWARRGLDPVAGPIEGLYAEWQAGRWTRIETMARPPAGDGDCLRFEDGILSPALLNAHVHLDYSFLRGALPRGQGFLPWLRGMIAARRGFEPGQSAAAEAACAAALQASLDDGVATLWDIDSLGWGRAALAKSAVESISFHEWIAPDPERWRESGIARLEKEPSEACESGARGNLRFGISPHTPYTVCPEALQALAGFAAEHGLPLAIHLAESPEERGLLVAGTGGLRDLLEEIGGRDPSLALGTGRGAIERAEIAGALQASTLAIHCNLPEPGDLKRLRRTGASVVFCPRSRRFFGYPAYPMAEYRRAGLRIALGTDSLASNDDLSMRAEARAALEDCAGLRPIEALELATGAGLGDGPFGGRGRFAAGGVAQWAHWDAQVGGANADAWAEAVLDPKSTCQRSSVKA